MDQFKEERLMILKMVAEGKITADEGALLLEALEKGKEKGDFKLHDAPDEETESKKVDSLDGSAGKIADGSVAGEAAGGAELIQEGMEKEMGNADDEASGRNGERIPGGIEGEEDEQRKAFRAEEGTEDSTWHGLDEEPLTGKRGKREEGEEESGRGDKEQERKKWKVFSDEFTQEMEDLARDMRDKAEKLRKEMMGQGKTVGAKVGELLDRFIAKVKEIDFDFDLSMRNALRVERSFVGGLPEDGKVELETYDGNIQVVGWDQKEYRVDVKGWVKEENETEAVIAFQKLLEVEETEEGLKVKIKRERGVKGNLLLYLPRSWDGELEAVTVNGTIKLTQVEASQVKLGSSNGSVLVTESEGRELAMMTSNGGIEVNGALFTELTARTSNGGIRIEGVFTEANCQSVNGQIQYRLTQLPEEGMSAVDLVTTNGQIDLLLPKGNLAAGGRLVTLHGSLECLLPEVDLTQTTNEAHEREVSFATRNKADGEAAVEVYCKTTHGPIKVREL